MRSKRRNPLLRFVVPNYAGVAKASHALGELVIIVAQERNIDHAQTDARRHQPLTIWSGCVQSCQLISLH